MHPKAVIDLARATLHMAGLLERTLSHPAHSGATCLNSSKKPPTRSRS